MGEPLALLLGSLSFNSEPNNFQNLLYHWENDSMSSLLTVDEKDLRYAGGALSNGNISGAVSNTDYTWQHTVYLQFISIQLQELLSSDV